MKQQQQNDLEIFNAALEIAAAEDRAAYLDSVCAGDPALRKKIDSLLVAYEKGPDTLDDLTRKTSRNEAGRVGTECAPNSVIGRYKLLEKIGEGGFGVVYLAEQKEPVKRRVALKIIKLGMDTKQVVARFEAERQALALMDHPNIAKVFDGGITDGSLTRPSATLSPTGGEGRGEGDAGHPRPSDGRGAGGEGITGGRPYFVMELVRGVPITQYCDENQLSPDERLQLFLQVCQAVQHAHQKGIIHRDLKPSNILVTVNDGVPVPKVIDFGVAKATQQELTEKTIATQFHHFIGTPAYMSPEQAQMTSLDIDTRSDIYALGVLLYELLTGKTPFDGKELLASGLDAMRQTIREKEPARPSTRLSTMAEADRTTTARLRKSEPPQLIHLLRGDLDWIVMKALEKDRNRRYETANGLAADIKRHLDNEPVVARPPSTAYRFEKLVRRHRTAAAAIALVALTIFVGVAVCAWALFREQKALKQADERLRASKKFISQIFDNVAPKFSRLAGAGEAQEKLADASVDFVRELGASGADDRELNMAVARVLLYSSHTQNLGEPNSVGDYEKALRWAREATALLTKKPLDTLSPDDLKMLYDAKRGGIATMLAALGKYDQSLAQIEEVEPLRQRLALTPEYASWSREERVANISQMGMLVNFVGRPKEAIARYFLPLLESDWPTSVGAESSERELELLANSNGWMAGAYYMLEDFQRAVPPTAEAVRVSEIMVRRFPKNARHPIYCAAYRAQRGLLLMLTGHPNEGVADLTRSRTELDALGSADPGNDLLRLFRCHVAAFQAQALAFWSKDAAALLTERRDRLRQAEAALASAEEILPALKARPPQEVLLHAHARIAAAKESLKSNPTKSAPR